MYVCPECGALYTERVPADEGTDPCDGCGAELRLIEQNDTGIIRIGGKDDQD
jgi:hypothetical protein